MRDVVARVLREHKFWFTFEGYDKCSCSAEVPRSDHPEHVADAILDAMKEREG